MADKFGRMDFNRTVVMTLTDKTGKLLRGAEACLSTQRGLIGLDGFVDQIIRVVDKRQHDGRATYLRKILEWGTRIQEAASKSTKFELSVQQVKLGGNGPIMANALVNFGLPVTCIGTLGFPELHPVFQSMKNVCQMFTVADVCYTDAVEFDDGKIMLSRQESAAGMTWEALERVIGKDQLIHLFDKANFVALDNWTALPHMSEIWRKLQEQICPHLSTSKEKKRRKLFFDLADPEFRLAEDIREAMELIPRFQPWFETTLGLNQKEAEEIAEVLKISVKGKERDFVRRSAEAIRSKLGIDGVVVHATAYAADASPQGSALVDGPFVEKPLILTGAGDHFNAGYSLGKILSGDLKQCLQLGVATSGFYVRTAKSPTLKDLREFLKQIGS